MQTQCGGVVDLHFRERAQPRGKHAFVGRARRKLRRAREVGKCCKYELGRVDGIDVRQRTDRRGDASAHPVPTHEGS